MRTAFRTLVVLAVTGLWIAVSGAMPVQRFVEDRERTSASTGLQGKGSAAAEQRKRGESKEDQGVEAVDTPPHANHSPQLLLRAVVPSSARTDAVPFAELRSTRARGPPTSTT